MRYPEKIRPKALAPVPIVPAYTEDLDPVCLNKDHYGLNLDL